MGGWDIAQIMPFAGIKERYSITLAWIALMFGALNLAMSAGAIWFGALNGQIRRDLLVAGAAFDARLCQEVDLEDLQAQIVAVVEETLQPEIISLWKRTEEREAAGGK